MRPSVALSVRATLPELSSVDEYGCNCLNVKAWALNSAVECHPHTVEVVGSNPTAPTISAIFETCPEAWPGLSGLARSGGAGICCASASTSLRE